MSPAQQVRKRALSADITDWSLVLDRAECWEVAPLVFANLLANFKELLPPAVIEEVRARSKALRARSFTMTLSLLDVVQRLENAGIKNVVLKGPATAITAYGDPTLRTFADFDLLVHRSDLGAAMTQLSGAGYIPRFIGHQAAWLIREQHALVMDNGRTEVDLHSTLFARYQRLNFDETALWEGSRMIDCLNGSIRVLDPAHQFVYLSAHAAKHQWSHFRWICDLAQLMSRLGPDDVEQVVEIAKLSGSKRLVALGVRVVEAVFGDEGPADLRALARPSETSRLVPAATRALFSDSAVIELSAIERLNPSLAPLLYWAACRERFRDRIASIARLILAPSLTDLSAWPLHWFARPFRLASELLKKVANAQVGKKTRLNRS